MRNLNITSLDEYVTWFDPTGNTTYDSPEFYQASGNAIDILNLQNYIDVSGNPFYCDCPIPLENYSSNSNCPNYDIYSMINGGHIFGYDDTTCEDG